MSLAQLFKRRKNLSLEVKVPYPPESPEVILTIARMSAVEERQVGVKAFAPTAMVDRDAKDQVFSVAFACGLVESLQKHVKGWEWLGEDKPEFTPENVKAFFDEFSTMGAINFFTAYNNALAADNEAAEKKTTSAQVSATA